jgi:hypothetical protein
MLAETLERRKTMKLSISLQTYDDDHGLIDENDVEWHADEARPVGYDNQVWMRVHAFVEMGTVHGLWNGSDSVIILDDIEGMGKYLAAQA